MAEEGIILYPGVEEEDFHEATKEILSEDKHSTVFLAKEETELKSIEKNDFIDLSSDSDIDEKFHAVVSSIKNEERKLQKEQIQMETMHTNPPGSYKIPGIPRFQAISQDAGPSLSLCRLCAVPCNNMIYIFGSTIWHKNIINKIQHCLPITITETDNLSKRVCPSCLQQLDSCYRFHKTVVEAERQLLVFYEQTSGGLTQKMKNHCQTLQSNEQCIVMENITNGQKLNRDFDENVKSIESKDFSNEINENPSFENENTNQWMESPKFDKTSLLQITQGFCSSMQNDAEDLKKELESVEVSRVSQSVNDSSGSNERETNPLQVESQKTRIAVKSSYSLRKRKPKKYNKYDDDSLYFDGDIESDTSVDESVEPEILTKRILDENDQRNKLCERSSGENLRNEEIVGNDPDQNKDPPKCTLCYRVLSADDTIENHRKNCPFIMKKYSCPYCDRFFHQKIGLARHLPSHTGELPYPCNICSKAFRNTQTRKQHMVLNHIGETRAVRCNLCRRPLCSKESMEKHMKYCPVHLETYKCPYCGKVFNQKPDLTFHLPTHTGKRPYKCEICSRRFAHEQYKKRHMKIHTRGRKFKCDSCEKEFIFRNGLKKHIITMHIKEEHIAKDET